MLAHAKKPGDDNTDHNHEESVLNPITTVATQKTEKSSTVIDLSNATPLTTSTNTRATTTPIHEDPNPITQTNTPHSPTNNAPKRSEFVKPQPDDILCNEQIDITKCNAIKRIIHALEYYKMYHMVSTDLSYVLPFSHSTLHAHSPHRSI
eukprot:832582_1